MYISPSPLFGAVEIKRSQNQTLWPERDKTIPNRFPRLVDNPQRIVLASSNDFGRGADDNTIKATLEEQGFRVTVGSLEHFNLLLEA